MTQAARASGAVRPGESIIDDTNFQQHIAPHVDAAGETKAKGLVPRNYSTHPTGYSKFAPPFKSVSIPLVPRSEWPERLKDQIKEGSRLSDVRLRANKGQLIPSLDQNGQGYCHTADTEVLTEKGWKLWPEYNGFDLLGTMNQASGNLEFQAPLERQVFEYNGEMIHSTNRRIDFGVTPNHRMLVRKWDESQRTLSDSYSFVTAENMGWYVGLPHATRGFVGTNFKRLAVEGDREYSGDDFIALLGLITSDGYAGGTDKTRNWVSFASFREETRKDIASLAARVGFHECPGRHGVWIRYDAGALANWIRTNCYTGPVLGSQNKRVPDLVKVASMQQIKHFLHYFDDRNRDGKQFYSTSKRMIDDLQELFLRVGKRSHIGWDPAKDVPYAGNADGVIHSKGGYVLTVGEVDRLCLDRKKHIEQDRYKGLVYCATVPNSTLVTRRNGSVLVSGNCWAYSTTMALMIVRARMNQEYVRLSAHAVGCKVKNFQDEGGWCGLSMEFVTENGVPSEEFWPQKSMSRSNDKPETWANAKLYRPTEGWVDLDAAVYDRQLSFDQVMSLLMTGTPVVGDFNWWGHSVCLLDGVDVDPGKDVMDDSRWGTRPVNSWTDQWEDRGMVVLKGNKAIPDGAISPRATLAS